MIVFHHDFRFRGLVNILTNSHSALLQMWNFLRPKGWHAGHIGCVPCRDKALTCVALCWTTAAEFIWVWRQSIYLDLPMGIWYEQGNLQRLQQYAAPWNPAHVSLHSTSLRVRIRRPCLRQGWLRSLCCQMDKRFFSHWKGNLGWTMHVVDAASLLERQTQNTSSW